jgi:hypothetical protein
VEERAQRSDQQEQRNGPLGCDAQTIHGTRVRRAYGRTFSVHSVRIPRRNISVSPVLIHTLHTVLSSASIAIIAISILHSMYIRFDETSTVIPTFRKRSYVILGINEPRFMLDFKSCPFSAIHGFRKVGMCHCGVCQTIRIRNLLLLFHDSRLSTGELPGA